MNRLNYVTVLLLLVAIAMAVAAILLFRSVQVSVNTANPWCFNDVKCTIGDADSFTKYHPEYCKQNECKAGDIYTYKTIITEDIEKRCKMGDGPKTHVNSKFERCAAGSEGCGEMMVSCLTMNTLDGPVDISLHGGIEALDQILKYGKLKA